MAVALQAHSRRSELEERLAQLPAELSLEGWPDERLLVPLRERAAVLAELDRILELDPANPVRIVRAAERLDAGDLRGAAADMRELARETRSAYLNVLAERYEQATPAGGDALAIALDNLPEPQRPADFLVAGFHALRARQPEIADDLLGRAGPDFLPARDLRLLAAAARKDPDPDRLVAEASWLEGHYGRPTARTRHVLGAAMLLQQRYDAAVGYCEEALALRPDRHGPWHNLGLCHLRLGNLEEAQRCYEKAHAIRPWFVNTQSGLCQTLRQQGRFGEARAVAEQIQNPSWREYELGNVALVQAIKAGADADPALENQMAAAAQSHFTAAAAAPAAARNPKARSIELAARFAGALASDDLPAAVAAFLLQLRSDPRNPRQLANLSHLLARTEITDEVHRLLRLFLLDLAVELAPGDPEYQRLRKKLLEQLSNDSRK
jgi:tetratricopeptide (TPR) repeat protein